MSQKLIMVGACVSIAAITTFASVNAKQAEKVGAKPSFDSSDSWPLSERPNVAQASPTCEPTPDPGG